MIATLFALALAQDELQWGPIKKGQKFALMWEFDETCEVASGEGKSKVRDVREVAALLTALGDIGQEKGSKVKRITMGEFSVELRRVRWTRSTDEYEVRVTLEDGELKDEQTITSFEDFRALAEACGQDATQEAYVKYERAARVRAANETGWMKQSVLSKCSLKLGPISMSGPFRIGSGRWVQQGPANLLAWAYLHDDVPTDGSDSWKAKLHMREAGYGASHADLDDPRIDLAAGSTQDGACVSGSQSWNFDRSTEVKKKELDAFGVALGALTAGMSWLVLPPVKDSGETDVLRKSGTHEVSKEFTFSRQGHLSSSRLSIGSDATWSWEKSGKETKFRYAMAQSLKIEPEE